MQTSTESVIGMNPVDWAAVEAFFYRAMVEGWASGKAPERHRHERYIQHTEGALRLVDRWWKVGGRPMSSGYTTIEMDISPSCVGMWVPIWQMHYGGSYDKSASAFVKEVLLGAFRNPKGFNGCRGSTDGATRSACGGYWYVNCLSRMPSEMVRFSGMSFTLFGGTESVYRGRSVVGYHRYFGMALV